MEYKVPRMCALSRICSNVTVDFHVEKQCIFFIVLWLLFASQMNVVSTMWASAYGKQWYHLDNERFYRDWHTAVKTKCILTDCKRSTPSHILHTRARTWTTFVTVPIAICRDDKNNCHSIDERFEEDASFRSTMLPGTGEPHINSQLRMNCGLVWQVHSRFSHIFHRLIL